MFLTVKSDGSAFGSDWNSYWSCYHASKTYPTAAIVSAMAVVSLTTFYGAVLANAFALPLKNKVKYRSGREALKMNIIVAGTLGIVAGEKIHD